MSIAARCGQAAVVLVLAGLLVWRAVVAHRQRRALQLERFRRYQEP
jgi:hypothetical protein